MNTSKPLILIDPLPLTVSMCFAAAAKDRLAALGRLVVHESARMPAAMVEEHLAEVEVLIGQTDMPAERLERAQKLRAIINIEGNFLPNVDYVTCFRRGIWVLNASPVFAETVAEIALGMMLDLARGIAAADRAFRAGREVWGLESNKESFLIRGQPVGLIGFGDLGRAFRRLLVPFGCPIKVYDPWLPDLLIRDHDCTPAGLDEVLETSRIIAVFAAVTSDAVFKVLAVDGWGELLARELPWHPDTVQAVLAARIDRLPPEEKRLLQTAAVIGHEVPLHLLQVIA